MGFCEAYFALRIARCDCCLWVVNSPLISEVLFAIRATRQYFLIVDCELNVSGDLAEDSY